MIRSLLLAALLAFTGPAAPQAFDSDSFDTDSFDDSSFWFSGAAPPTLSSGYTYRDGIAFDSAGRMATEFLGQSEAVPSTARFIEGVAYTAQGVRYVAAWPTNGLVKYIDGYALRNDGAAIVILDGTPARHNAGIAVGSRGETIVTESAPTRYIQGVGLDQNGRLSVTNGN